MATQPARIHPAAIAARIDLRHASYAVAISDLACDGCALDDCDFCEEGEFVHLKIDDRIDINGTVAWRRGKRIGVRFHGQIHPVVVGQLSGTH